ncbi:MAG: hypothetical protein C4547_10290, partial [Phycisphaerales bacterium]
AYRVTKVKSKKGCGDCPFEVGDEICSEEECRFGKDCDKSLNQKLDCPQGGFCIVKAKLIGCTLCE